MALGLKILAAVIGVMGTISFPYLILVNQSIRTSYWNLVGQNIIYASIGAIATFAFIIALSNLLWNKK